MHAVVGPLAQLPPGKLERIAIADPDRGLVLPRLPEQVIMAVCYAGTVDAEVLALVCDLSERNRNLILTRWGIIERILQPSMRLGRRTGSRANGQSRS